MYRSKLEKNVTVQGGLPWVGPVLQRIAGITLSEFEIDSVLYLVTGLVILMNNEYINYNVLFDLNKALPSRCQQIDMVKLCVLSREIHPKFSFGTSPRTGQ